MKREFRVTIDAQSSAGMQFLHYRTTVDSNGLNLPKSGGFANVNGGSKQVKA